MNLRSHDLGTSRPEVHVLVPFGRGPGAPASPDCATTELQTDVAGWFAPLGLDWSCREVTSEDVKNVVADLAVRAARQALVVLNLCGGSDGDGDPAVVDALSAAGLAYSGAGPTFHRASSSKLAMKALLRSAGVATPPWIEIKTSQDLAAIGDTAGYPALLKLSESSAGLGLDRSAVVRWEKEARTRHDYLVSSGYSPLGIFAERFLTGDEMTVFVYDTPWTAEGLAALPAVQVVYDRRVPVTERLLFEGHRHVGLDGGQRRETDPPRCVYAAAPAALQPTLMQMALAAYRAVGGDGYARVDMRRDETTGRFDVLEVDANPALDRTALSLAPALAAAEQPFESLIEDILAAALLRQPTPVGRG